MKKVFSIFTVCVISILLFAGCGYSGSTTATGIAFSSKEYYVDLRVPTKLEYKVYPSSASSISPQFIPSVDKPQYITFDTDTGIISIDNAEVSSVNVTIKYQEYEDNCVVYLKSYPDNIYFNSNVIDLHAGGTAKLSYSGLFGGEEKKIDTTMYNTKLVSSNPSVVSIVNSNNLIVKSTGRSGSATITAYMVNTKGEVVNELSASVVVNVVSTIDECALKIDGRLIKNISKFADENVTTITLSGYSQQDLIRIEAIFTDKYDFILDEADYVLTSADESIAKIDGKSVQLVASGDVEILITPNIYDTNGNPIVFKILLDVNLIA